MVRICKKVFLGLWICVIIYLVYLYIQNPAIASPENIRTFIASYGSEAMFVYISLTLVRGFFLIPSTPFVIGGAMLFPDKLFFILIISMVGVMFSATVLYYFSDMLGFSHYLEAKYPKKIGKWKQRLQDPKATYFVLGWSFFSFSSYRFDLLCSWYC